MVVGDTDVDLLRLSKLPCLVLLLEVLVLPPVLAVVAFAAVVVVVVVIGANLDDDVMTVVDVVFPCAVCCIIGLSDVGDK